MKYRRIQVPRHGGPEVLRVVEEDLPEPRSGEVRVKVLAAGVSAYDLMLRRAGNRLPKVPRVPYTPGEDIVGRIGALGAGVTDLAVDQIVGGVTFSQPGGGYAEYLCLPATDLVPVPAGVDPAEAVCLAVNYLTAHVAIHRTAAVQRGERILVHGAAGGVGSALVELGRLVGAEMYGTASRQNLDLVDSLGAIPIDYRADDFVKRVHGLEDGGVDAAFDPVGGARQLWCSYRSLRRGGRLVWLGVVASGREGMGVIPRSLLMQLILSLLPDGRRAPTMPDLAKVAGADGQWYRRTLAELFGLLAAGELKPVVAARIPLLEAARGHELLERGGHAGKVVLVTGD
jgi:NADPH2:quinone reductase